MGAEIANKKRRSYLFIKSAIGPDCKSRQISCEPISVNSFLCQIAGTNSHLIFQVWVVEGSVCFSYHCCVVLSINIHLGSTAVSNHQNMMPFVVKNGWFVLKFCIAVDIAVSVYGLTFVQKNQLAPIYRQREMYTVEAFLISVGNNSLATFGFGHLDPCADGKLVTNVIWQDFIRDVDICLPIEWKAKCIWKRKLDANKWEHSSKFRCSTQLKYFAQLIITSNKIFTPILCICKLHSASLSKSLSVMYKHEFQLGEAWQMSENHFLQVFRFDNWWDMAVKISVVRGNEEVFLWQTLLFHSKNLATNLFFPLPHSTDNHN